MFVAIRPNDSSRVTSISREWEGRVEELRQLTAEGGLICPGCEQTLWLRVGRLRRRHFAHRSIADCPLARESVEVLEAKASLFTWLELKYAGRVQMDMPLSGDISTSRKRTSVKDPGIADLLVDAGSETRFAYWVFDRQQREREGFLCPPEGVSANIIHTASTLQHEPESQTIILTASQRDFIRASPYDANTPQRGHLHFLTGEGELLIFRGLRCVHEPNVFGFRVFRKGYLGRALISPRTGELVFAEDVTERDAWRREREAAAKARALADLEAKAKAQARAELEAQATARALAEFEAINREVQTASPSSLSPANPKHKPAEPAPPINCEPVDVSDDIEPPRTPLPDVYTKPLKCEDCGTLTTEWSTAKPGLGTCVCHPCLKQRRAKRLEGKSQA